MIKLPGASMVTLRLRDFYTSVERGVIDGFAFPTYGALQSRYYVPAKYLLRPAFGFRASAVLANLATWNKFSGAEKKIILDEGVKHEDKWLRESETKGVSVEWHLLRRIRGFTVRPEPVEG